MVADTLAFSRKRRQVVPCWLVVVAALALVVSTRGAPGQLDPSFHVDLDGWVYSMALQPDGKIVIGGVFEHVNGAPVRGVVRLNSDGSTDTSFHAEIDGDVWRLVIQPDGRIIILGLFEHVNGVPKERMARLHSDGSLDTSHNSGPHNSYSPLILQADGKLLMGGYQNVYRLNQDGTPDTNFVVKTSRFGDVYAVTVLDDGKILIGGNFTSINGFRLESVGRLNSDGTVDGSFQTAGQNMGDGNRVLIQRDEGIIFMGGDVLAKLTPEGRLVPDFSTRYSNIPEVQAMVFDGTNLLVGGQFPGFAGIVRTNLTRLTPNGTVDLTYNPAAGANGIVYGMALQRDGRLIVGGDFTVFAGQPRAYLVRLVGDQPPLSISHAGNAVAVRWSSRFTNWKLQSSSLLPATNWVNVEPAPVKSSNDCVVTNSSSGDPARFFRLVSPE